MDLIRKICFPLLFVVFVIILSCQKQGRPSEVEVGPMFAVPTKDGGAPHENNTYRILAYWGDGTYANFGCFSTTRMQGSDEIMSGNWGGVNDDGSLAGSGQCENHLNDLAASGTQYYFMALSPGRAVERDYLGGARVTNWTPYTTPLYGNTPEKVNLGSYKIVRFTGENNVLKDLRSRIIINIYRSVDVGDFTMCKSGVNDLSYVTGASRDLVHYYPFTRQTVIPTGSAQEIQLNMTDRKAEHITAESGAQLCYSCGPIYVPAGVYTRLRDRISAITAARTGIVIPEDDPKIAEGSDILLYKCRINRGGTGEDATNALFRVPLTDVIEELLPMHTYTFNLTVMSDYISVTLKVARPAANSENHDWRVLWDTDTISTSNMVNLGRFNYDSWDMPYDPLDDDENPNYNSID